MIRRLTPWVLAAVASVAFAALILTAGTWLARSVPRPPRSGPTITTSYYAEPSGRQCSRTVVQASSGVAVAVSCSYPPAESRIRDLLEGAGQ